MLPTFIGIGTPKSGTTWLFRCLAEHPEVFITPVKETAFFASSFDPEALDTYHRYFEGGQEAIAVGEISVDYFDSEPTPARIAQVLPDVKLVVVFRNPIDQVYSHYWHLARQNFHSWEEDQRLSFEAALDKYSVRLIEPASYAKYLKSWLRYFNRDQIHVIFYEEICQQPQTVLQRLFEFLGVDPTFLPSALDRQDVSVRKGVSPKSPLLDQIHSILYQQLNQQFYMPLKHLLGFNVAAQLKETLRIRQIMQTLFYREGYPKMAATTRTALCDRFSPDIQELATLTGRDLSHWLGRAGTY